MRLSKRELFILGCALRYALANLEDVNVAFEDYEDDHLLILDQGVAGSPLEEFETQELAERLIECIAV